MTDGELGKGYHNGDIIFKEGDKGDMMYVIQSGKVKITKNTDSGDITVATLGTGEIFGEMALFDKLHRSATVSALGNTRVLSIDRKKLFSTISHDPTLAFKIIESMSKRLRRLNEDLMDLSKNESDMLGVCIDIDETCSLILKEVRKIVRADNGSIMLADDDGKSLSIKAAFGPEANPKIKFSVGKGIAGDVLRTGRAELINNVSMDSRFISGGKHIKSMLCVPLKADKRVFGVINVSNSSENLFTLDDLKLLRSLAIYASIAIQNARNLSNLKNATSDLLRHATMLDML